MPPPNVRRIKPNRFGKKFKTGTPKMENMRKKRRKLRGKKRANMK